LSVRPHFATLDGLRVIAAVVIVAHHAFDPFGLSPLIPHSGLAVDLLFCLSGFVLGYAYEAKLLSSMSFSDFVVIRIIRLYPLIVLGTLTGFMIFSIKSIVAHESPFAANYIFILICELLLIPSPISIGQEGWGGITPFNTPAWSLFFQFIANFVYAAVARHLSDRVLGIALIFGAALVLAQSYIFGGVTGGGTIEDLYGGFSRVFFPFFCGVFLYRLWKANPSAQGSPYYTPIILGTLLFVFFCPVPASINWLFESVAVLVVFPAIILLGTRDRPSKHVVSLCLFLGPLAYPLYILHYPVLRVFIKYEHANSLEGAPLWLVLTAEILTTMVFAIAMMLLYDEPLRAWLSEKWRARRRNAGDAKTKTAGDPTSLRTSNLAAPRIPRDEIELKAAAHMRASTHMRTALTHARTRIGKPA
jgi:peptidoglycan/LPS O-acetylase OafA/YrhL